MLPEWPIPKFASRMRLWLRDAGYWRCCSCGLWDENVSTRCRDCNRKYAREYYRTPQGKAYPKKYRSSHPEVIRAATARYLQKMRSTEEGREILRDRNQRNNARNKLKYQTDETFRTKQRERHLKLYYKLMATEEGREKIRRQRRERYHRRKNAQS